MTRILPDPGSPLDSAIYEDSRGFYPFSIPDRSIFRYLHGFDLIPVVLRILPFIGLHADSTFSGYLIDQFFGTRTDLLDPDSPPDSAIYRYSRGFYPFSIRDRSLFRYSHGFYLIPIVPRILPFIGIHADSTIFRYLTDQFFGTRTDSTRSR